MTETRRLFRQRFLDCHERVFKSSAYYDQRTAT